jgi:hypothetical protein
MSIRTISLLCLLLCSAAMAASDFTGDPNCIALWRFENAAFTADSIGTNTLNPVVTPSSDTGNYKEGSASVHYDDTEYLQLSDGLMDAGFPFKNGDATKNFSICFWFYMDSLPASAKVAVMYRKDATNKSVIQMGPFNQAGTTTMFTWIGYNGGASWEALDHGTAMSSGRWYHIGFTYQDSDRAYRMRIWDDTASALLGGGEVTGNYTNNINVEDAPLYIGGPATGFGIVGEMDEMVVFNDILSAEEIDQIRGGSYGSGDGGGQIIQLIMN